MIKYYLFPFLCVLLALNAFGQTYQSAESIEYDEVHNRFLISNGNRILARAADGTLSYFGTGNTSHGIEVMGDHLYGLASTVVKAFDLETEEEVMQLQIPGAQFLNGLTNDGNGLLYATDFSAKKIYKIDVTDLGNPSYEIIVENLPAKPNGILYDEANNRLLFVNWGSNAKIQAVDLTDYSISDIITTSFTNIDGIDDDSQHNYYISTWIPNRITKYDSNFENPITVITPMLSSPADIGYAMAIDTLAIPQGNTADYISFEVIIKTKNLALNDFNLLVYPNPVTEQSWIQFETKEAKELELRLIDLQGKVHYELQGMQPVGIHKIPLRSLALAGGQYQVIISSGETMVSTGLIKM